MPYMKKYPFLLLAILLLSSCAPAQTAPVAASTPAPSSPLDGQWQGTGFTEDGRSFNVFLTIQDSALSGLIYNFVGTSGVPCTAIAYGQIPAANRPVIENNLLDAKLGDDVDLTSIFASDVAVTGALTVHWHDRQPYCNGDYEVTWSAAKKIPQASSQSTDQPKPNTPNPFETFIQILIFGLSNGAVLALNAIGVTLIYGTVRTLNLAHGDVFALCTALVTSVVNIIGIQKNWPPLQIIFWLMFVLLSAMSLGTVLSMGV